MSSVSQRVINSQDGLVPRRPIEPVTQGSSLGSVALPRRAFAAPAPSRSATAITSSVACKGGADQESDVLAGVQDVGGATQIRLVRDGLRSLVTHPRTQRAMFTRRLGILHLLQVIRQYESLRRAAERVRMSRKQQMRKSGPGDG